MNVTDTEPYPDPTFYLIALLPQLGISVISWLQYILSLNRYRGVCSFTFAERCGLYLYLMAALVRVVSGSASALDGFALQLVSGCIGSLLAFSSFIVVYNNEITLPSRQQVKSIVLILATTALWEVHSRIFIALTAGSPQCATAQ